MKQISVWANRHVWPARLLLIFTHILLIVIAVYLAFLVTALGWNVPAAALPLLIVSYCYMFFVYVNRPQWKRVFWFRISMHTAMALISFLLVFTFAVQLNNPLTKNNVMAAVVIHPVISDTYKNPEAEKLLELIKKGEIKKLSKPQRKLLRSELKYQAERYKKAVNNNQKKDAAAVALIILTILLALVAIIGVGSLACTLSCNGNDGASVLVMVLGVALIIFLMVLAFRGIKKRKKTITETKTEKPSS